MKKTRIAEVSTEGKKKGSKREHQKLKSYMVLQYLLKNSDETHPSSVGDICDFLNYEYELDAERRSIYRDIHEINVVNLVINEGYSFKEAEEELDNNPDDNTIRLIRTRGNTRGMVVYAKPDYELDDIRLLIECVYATKFINEGQSKRLANIVSDLVSFQQKQEIEHDVLLTDRSTKTDSRDILYSVSTISAAMNTTIIETNDKDNTETHKYKPAEKISFYYQRNTISAAKGTISKKQGKRVLVSPYKLLINDGNYYLLAFNEKAQAIWTYRVDKMKDVRVESGVPRDGEEEFAQFDLKAHLQSSFNMFSGTERKVTLRFINPLLDVVYDKFGDKGASYCEYDESHFQVIAHVQISDQFFSWLAGFGTKAKIMDSPDIAEQYHDYLKRITEMYESE